jgi:hypothetical protein
LHKNNFHAHPHEFPIVFKKDVFELMTEDSKKKYDKMAEEFIKKHGEEKGNQMLNEDAKEKSF